jgi:hypothetical protein
MNNNVHNLYLFHSSAYSKFSRTDHSSSEDLHINSQKVFAPIYFDLLDPVSYLFLCQTARFLIRLTSGHLRIDYIFHVTKSYYRELL